MAKKSQLNTSNLTKKKTFDKSVLYQVEPAEVADIILSEDHPSYRTDSDIGSILFRRIQTDFKYTTDELFKAKPLNQYQKTYPIKYEMVNIYIGPSSLASVVSQANTYYYESPINVWNYQNHNALPYSTQTPGINNTNLSDFAGNQSSNEIDIELGDYFDERIKVPNLLPFEGDQIISGRYGNSIRFTSTTKKGLNIWSDKGEIGDPLLVLRVDKQTSENKFIVEDINNDNASIYITDGQSIDFQPDSFLQNSFKTIKPQKNKDFLESQIFLTAKRVHINSKVDSILMSAKKSTHISADDSINLDAKNYMAFDSQKIYLGQNAKNEQEPAILGNKTIDLISDILDELLKATYASAAGPAGPMLPPSLVILTQLKTRLKLQKFILSNKTYLE